MCNEQRVTYVIHKRKFDSITADVRDRLHWLPVLQRIEYKVCALIFKCLHQAGGTDVSHWTVLTGVWISQSWSPPFCRAGRPCSTTFQDNKIWPEKFCCCRSNFLKLTPIVSSRPVTNTISVLCTFENSFILQSIWNTSLARPWQFRL